MSKKRLVNEYTVKWNKFIISLICLTSILSLLTLSGAIYSIFNYGIGSIIGYAISSIIFALLGVYIWKNRRLSKHLIVEDIQED